MAHPTLLELFGRARQYLDTDELNFPNNLCNNLLRRVWFQAVSMEREWRFFQRRGTAQVTAGDNTVPFVFITNLPTPAVPATRLQTVSWADQDLVWREASILLRDPGTGEPSHYSELNDGVQRNILLWPTPQSDGILNVAFFAEPVYPVVEPIVDPAVAYNVRFTDLPDEFDDALIEGLLAEMYMREEDPDLYDVHRQMFLEQMGAIRNRWRESLSTPLVMGGRGRAAGHDPGGWSWPGFVTQPTG